MDKDTQYFQNQYEQVKKVNTDKGGEHYFVQDTNTGEPIMQKVYIFHEQERAKNFENVVQNRLNNYCQSVQRCYDYGIKTQRDLCSKFYIFSVYYEYPLKDLEGIFSKRFQLQKFFTHEELMSLYYSILDALCFFQQTQSGHGFVQPFNIYQNQFDKKYKLAYHFSSLSTRDQYFNYLYQTNEIRFFAPEIFEIFKHNNNEDIDTSKMDTFNLGLILLILGNFCKIGEIYNLYQYTLDIEKLNLQIKKFQSKFQNQNPLLVKIVQTLLKADVTQRLRPTQLRKKFPSEQQFLNTLNKKHQQTLSTENKKGKITKQPIDKNWLQQKIFTNNKQNFQK